MKNQNDIKIVKSWSYKRLSLSVAANGRMRVSAPKFISNRKIERFIQEYGTRLLAEKQDRFFIKAEGIEEKSRIMLPFLDHELSVNTLFNSASRPAILKEEMSSITVGIPLAQFEDRFILWQKEVKEYYRKRARNEFTKYASRFAEEMNVTFSRIRIGDQTSRWGSCSSNKTLSFNLRLMLAPEAVAAYVAVHEVAHLIEQNHSKKFWTIVEEYDPDYQKARSWLKTYGNELWKYF